MLSVDEALKLVLDRAWPLGSQRVEADYALGLLLAEPVTSDVDSPPHDKAIVDGYAVVASDAALPGVELTVLEEVTAGAVPSRLVEPGTATRIMTGAPPPRGADAIVMIEQTTLIAADRVRLLAAVKVGQNIMRRGVSLTAGQMVLEPGKRIRAIEAGLLAEIGRTHVLVHKWPSVAVLATGNELVDRCEQPGAGQIRNSNGPLLKALATQAGADAYEAMGPARDNVEDLARCIEPGLRHDVLLLSGGVSAGVLDLVPQVLADLGVEQVFHKVNLKPGKPLWFGVKQHQEIGRQTLVFGLPGNPVSTLVCFELFVRPAIKKLCGFPANGLPGMTAVLARDHQQRGERPTYWPAVVRRIDPPLIPNFSHELQTPLHSIIGFAEVLESIDTLNDKPKRYVQHILSSGRHLQEMIGDVLQLALVYGQSPPPKRETVSLLPWQGSGDLRTLTDANCLAHFPPGERQFQAGEQIEVLLLPEL